MHDDDWLTTRFEESRPRLHALAYRMLGSARRGRRRGAGDVAPPHAAPTRPRIENVGGLLTTVVGRVCLDRLRAAPGPTRGPGRRAAAGDDTPTRPSVDPVDEALLAESVGAALMVVLDRLGPAERVAFVLHDVFAVPFDDVGEILGRSPDATRQLASRARRRLQGTAPTAGLDLVRQRDVVDAFLRAARGGDFDSLMQLLDPEVVLLPDAAAVAMGSLRETRGAAAVASALSGGAQGAILAIVDGVAAFVWAPAGRSAASCSSRSDDDRIVAIDVTGDAERIRELDIVTARRLSRAASRDTVSHLRVAIRHLGEPTSPRRNHRCSSC